MTQFISTMVAFTWKHTVYTLRFTGKIKRIRSSQLRIVLFAYITSTVFFRTNASLIAWQSRQYKRLYSIVVVTIVKWSPKSSWWTLLWEKTTMKNGGARGEFSSEKSQEEDHQSGTKKFVEVYYFYSCNLKHFVSFGTGCLMYSKQTGSSQCLR